jgi:hypothetical protein
MLPITLSLAAYIAVKIVILIVIIIVIDLDVATVPIAVAPVAAPSAPSGRTQGNSRAPRQSCSWHVSRIRIGVIRIGRRSRSVHHSRVIRRDVNNVGVGLLNFDYLLSAGDCLGLHYRLGAGF